MLGRIINQSLVSFSSTSVSSNCNKITWFTFFTNQLDFGDWTASQLQSLGLLQATFFSSEPNSSEKSPIVSEEIFWSGFLLNYNVPWPVNIFINKNHVQRYNFIFRYLLLLKKADHALNQSWLIFRKNSSEESLEILIVLKKMRHFVANFGIFVKNGIETGWRDFTKRVRETNFIFEILEFHENFLSETERKYFFQNRYETIHKNVIKVTNMVALFTKK